MTKISVVTAMYKNEDCIEEFCQRIKNVMNDLNVDYEIILVNDKSPNNDLEVALEIYKKDRNIKIIDLSKNFGQHIAILSALERASGDYTVVIDIDLEENPEIIKDLYSKISNSDNDIIYTIRRDLGFSGLRQRLYRKIFWLLFSFISDYDLKKNISNARIMNSKFRKSLINHKERGWSLAMMTQICGFKQDTMIVNRIYKKKSSYTLLKRVKLFLSLILNYSNKPLHVAIYVGIIISSISFLFGFYVAIRKILYDIPIDGWSSIMTSIWFLGGTIIFFLGIMGTYIANIFIDVKQRPIYIVRNEYGFED